MLQEAFWGNLFVSGVTQSLPVGRWLQRGAASSCTFALTEKGEDHAVCMRLVNTSGSCKNFQDCKSSLSPEEASPPPPKIRQINFLRNRELLHLKPPLLIQANLWRAERPLVCD